MSADPWFQTLFADRIGGSAYGKGTNSYGALGDPVSLTLDLV